MLNIFMWIYPSDNQMTAPTIDSEKKKKKNIFENGKKKKMNCDLRAPQLIDQTFNVYRIDDSK